MAEERWRAPITAARLGREPFIAGRIFVVGGQGSDDPGAAVAVDVATGTIVWSQKDVRSAAAFGALDHSTFWRGDRCLAALDASSGRAQWVRTDVQTGTEIYGKLATVGHDGVLVASKGDGRDSVVHHLDSTDGAVRWRTDFAMVATAMLSVAGDRVVVVGLDFGEPIGEENWLVMGINRLTGAMDWKTPLRAFRFRDLVIVDETVVVAGYSPGDPVGAVLALDLDSGELRWRNDRDVGGPVSDDALAVVDDCAYMACLEGSEYRLVKLDPATGTRTPVAHGGGNLKVVDGRVISIEVRHDKAVVIATDVERGVSDILVTVNEVVSPMHIEYVGGLLLAGIWGEPLIRAFG